jgi:hypothetical protein
MADLRTAQAPTTKHLSPQIFGRARHERHTGIRISSHSVTVAPVMTGAGRPCCGLYHDGGSSWTVGVAPVGYRQDGDDPRVVIDGVQGAVVTTAGGQDRLKGRI